ncbi:MAG TPA: gluconokinase [Oleiagrimonas sp.]|nr:gluconokinase [Oleiagrimonas sp.]
MTRHPLVVVMGASGCGKSTIGAQLASKLGVAFVDGDDLHSAQNVAKMAAGHALTDTDRWPWLARVGQTLHAARDSGLVVACSALKRAYRDAILEQAPGTWFALLDVPRDVLVERLERRTDHFMPAALLDSQLSTLEPLAPDEPGASFDTAGDVGDVVQRVSLCVNTRNLTA